MNSAVMSRRGADGATGRGGTRTSLFGSIAEEIGALQSAAGFNHGKSNVAKTIKTIKRMDELRRSKIHRGVSGGEAWAEKAIRAGRPETCDVRRTLPEHFYRAPLRSVPPVKNCNQKFKVYRYTTNMLEKKKSRVRFQGSV